MRTFLFIGIAAFALGCASEKEILETVDMPVSKDILTEEEALNSDTTSEDPNIDGKPQRAYQVKGQIGEISSKKSDPYTIVGAKIVGNKLFVDITYSGGCAHHRFECVGSAAISKSLPPQRAIKIIHNNDNDLCESIVNQTIEIDIRPFAFSAAGPSEIVLNLEGFSGQLNYSNI